MDVQSGRSFELPDPWLMRARKAQRVGEAWLLAWSGAVERADVWMTAESVTFAVAADWHPRAIAELTAELRRRLGEKLIDYFWSAELQERGAVHYNVLLIVRKGTWVPMFDKAGLWRYGSSHHFGRIRTAKAASYLLRYTGKVRQKGGPGGPSFPKGLRLYGMRLSRTVGDVMRLFVRLSILPAWLRRKLSREVLAKGYMPRRVRGGGWWFDGERYFSPWRWSASAPMAYELVVA